MTKVFLEFPSDVHEAIWRHLVRDESEVEQVAFIYTQRHAQDRAEVFRYVEWFGVPPEGFVTQSEFHLELADAIRPAVIKRAHDLGASLAEFHFHAGPWPAEFSPSDFMGLREFVPHMWWRLKGRPYLAVVVSRSSFDGLVWLQDPNSPQRLDGLLVNGEVLVPTGLTSLPRYGRSV